MTKKFIIALGGSIICPKDINTNFLRKFSLFIKKEVKKGNKFIIVIGGGNISRIYQEAASKITKLSDENKDWLGIHYEGNLYYKGNHCPGQVLRNCVHPDLGLQILFSYFIRIPVRKSNTVFRYLREMDYFSNTFSQAYVVLQNL